MKQQDILNILEQAFEMAKSSNAVLNDLGVKNLRTKLVTMEIDKNFIQIWYCADTDTFEVVDFPMRKKIQLDGGSGEALKDIAGVLEIFSKGKAVKMAKLGD